MTKDTTPTSGAADLPEALRLADLFELESDPESLYRLAAAELRRLHALAAGQATAAQPVAEPADTVVLNAAMRAIQQAIELIGAPTDERMRAVRRVLRGAVVVAEDSGVEVAAPAAPAQPAAPQGVAYAALPTSSHAGSFLIGTCPLYTADQLHAFADATHALRASHGQAPAKPDPAYSAACNLATALFKKHFAHLPDFASGQVVWGLCDSTAGVISQIDNMVSGLLQPPTTAFSEDEL